VSVATPSAARVGRDGALRLVFERRRGATVLAACRSTLPLQVLVPVALGDAAAVVSMLNPTGGVVGGDRLAVEIDVGPGAHACLTTPSATRVHRSAGEPAIQTAQVRLAPGAVCEWVPDHTIPSPGAELRQALTFDVAAGATLIAVDAWAAGRISRGEAWRFRLLDLALTVRDGGGLLTHDRLVLGPTRDWSALGLTEGRPYVATIVVVADTGLEALIAALATGLPGEGQAVAGAARLARRAVLIRCLAATAPALTSAVAAMWARARHATLGLPALDLRKG